MRSILVCVVAWSVMVGAVSAQFPGVPPLPEIEAPSGVPIMSGGGYGVQVAAENAKLELPATGRSYRLKTTLTTDALAKHYSAQLTPLGWKQTARFMDPNLGLVRFTTGSEADPMTGIVTVLPFPATGEVVIAIRLVRSKAPWRERPRAGGAGASAGAPKSVEFFTVVPVLLTLPASVQYVERRGGGGGNDFYYADVRLETTLPTSVLMTAMLKQVSGAGWSDEVHLGDAMQTVVRRTSLPEKRRSEVWMLTSMPGVSQVDALVSSSCRSRPTVPVRNLTGIPSVPCDEAR